MQVCTTTEPITAEPHHSLHDNGTKVHGRISPQSAKLRAASHPLLSELNRTSYKMDNVSIMCISMLQYSNSLKDKGNVATNITTIPTKACKSVAAIASFAIAKPHPGLQGNGAGILITMTEYNILQDNVSVPSITITARTQHSLKQRQRCIDQNGGTSLQSARQWQHCIHHHGRPSLQPTRQWQHKYVHRHSRTSPTSTRQK